MTDHKWAEREGTFQVAGEEVAQGNKTCFLYITQLYPLTRLNALSQKSQALVASEG